MMFFRQPPFRFELRKPRNPLARVLLGLIGVVVLALLLVAGLFIGLGMLAFAAGRRLLRPAAASASASSVLEGEYVVVDKAHVTLAHR